MRGDAKLGFKFKNWLKINVRLPVLGKNSPVRCIKFDAFWKLQYQATKMGGSFQSGKKFGVWLRARCFYWPAVPYCQSSSNAGQFWDEGCFEWHRRGDRAFHNLHISSSWIDLTHDHKARANETEFWLRARRFYSLSGSWSDYWAILGTNRALNGISGAIESSIVCMSILHGSN